MARDAPPASTHPAEHHPLPLCTFQARDSAERSVESVLRQVKQDIVQQMPGLSSLLADSAVVLVTKTTHLALLIGA